MKPFIKHSRILINTVFTAALLVSVLLLVFTTFSPLKAIYLYKVMSGSMEPAIHTGSVVITQIIQPAKLRKGDVISYTANNDESATITHRLVNIKSKKNSLVFNTKGDANKTNDPDEITPQRIKGKVLVSIPFLGYVLEWLKTPLGFIIAIVVPALYIVISEAFTVKKIIEQSAVEKYKKEQSISKYLVMLLFFSMLISFIGAKSTLAYFSRGTVFSNITISVANFAPPETPTLLLPENHSLATAGGVKFSWSNVGDGVTYSVRTANNNNFTKIYDWRDILTGPHFTFDLADGSYWWQVKACKRSDVCSEWSDPWKLTVIPVENKQTLPVKVHLEPTLDLTYDPDLHEVHYSLKNIGDYNKLRYELTYKSDGQDEGVVGKENITEGFFEGNIYLGTCSDKVCSPHLNVSAINFDIYLEDGKNELQFQAKDL